ncbi:F-box and associated interaction domains-containing protein putative isoform 1 [Tripterygium wilfordii]|uniref:F-box and associated interaction domains-containing protein putative isoform 1 n=1 Tax=Tripterygium wilfordii TaxID=458696 RepID=A0A7J7CX88_TRIWF|nr:F-box protein CPR1-like [Tripterygium wilfordii]KAF5738618.1 F-box and associated interaction domains-containing protein putative isoform 1 [Tripterygium wilfordii]
MAAAINSYITDDLVTAILTCLPVKSLLRFRCVCKSWSVLTENPDFITKHHLKRNIIDNNTVNAFVKRNGEPFGKPMMSTLKGVDNEEILTVVESNFVPSCDQLIICGSRNGILCLHNPDLYSDVIVLWNPSTRDLKTLPESPLEPPDTRETLFGDIGFGFDRRTNDYKVIRFVLYRCDDDDDKEEEEEEHDDDDHDEEEEDDDDEDDDDDDDEEEDDDDEEEEEDDDYFVGQVELYSLKSDSWRVIPRMNADIFPCCYYCNTYKDGVKYWWGRKSTDDSQWLMSFDMVEEVFETVELPSDFGDFRNPVFSVFNGQLCMVLYIDDKMESLFEIWVMTDNGVRKTWVEQMTIQVSGVLRPLEFWKDRGLFLEDDQGQLVLYDIRTKEMKNLQLRGKRYTFQVVNYEESLVPINSRRAQNNNTEVEEQQGLASQMMVLHDLSEKCSFNVRMQF